VHTTASGSAMACVASLESALVGSAEGAIEIARG
jgi:hypothetical protein